MWILWIRSIIRYVNRTVKYWPSVTLGKSINKWANTAPVPWPIIVILSGSPPKNPMFFLSQSSAAIWSHSPKLLGVLSLVPGLRKPEFGHKVGLTPKVSHCSLEARVNPLEELFSLSLSVSLTLILVSVKNPQFEITMRARSSRTPIKLSKRKKKLKRVRLDDKQRLSVRG